MRYVKTNEIQYKLERLVSLNMTKSMNSKNNYESSKICINDKYIKKNIKDINDLSILDKELSISTLTDSINGKIYIFLYNKNIVEEQIDRDAIIVIEEKEKLSKFSKNYLEKQGDYQGLIFKLF